MSIAGIDGLPFYAITPRVVLYAVFGQVVHRLQYPGAYDFFLEGLLLAECIAGTKGNSEPDKCQSGHSECGMPLHYVHTFMVPVTLGARKRQSKCGPEPHILPRKGVPSSPQKDASSFEIEMQQ